MAGKLMDSATSDFRLLPRITHKSASFYTRNCYDCLRMALQAFLALDGWKPYSHEAILQYALEQDVITRREMVRLDAFRKLRHAIEYTGEQADETDAADIKTFAEKLLPKLEKQLLSLGAGRT